MTQSIKSFTIPTAAGERRVGPGFPALLIAEMSGNHNQSLDTALKMVDVAAEAGVDAIKLQTYTADTLTIDCTNEFFQVKVNEDWKGKTLYELYGLAHTPWEWHQELQQYAESKGLIFFSTPFDETAVDFLESMNVPLYKVASFETGDLPLLRKIGSTQKPVIISRGLTSESELELAVQTLRQAGCPQVAILHCVSSYPAQVEQMNLLTIPMIAEKFDAVSGLSDHSLGGVAPMTAISLGASIIEKHFTLSRDDGGPDAAFSLEPKELRELVTNVRQVELALGKASFEIGKAESENVVFRKSIFVVEDIKQGMQLTSENVRIIRPGYGLAPREFDAVVGKRACCDLQRGTPLSWEHLQE